MFERYNEIDGFVKVPYSGAVCYLSANGDVDVKNETVKLGKDSTGITLEFDWIDGVKKYSLALLLAFTFKTPRLPIDLWKHLSIRFKDNDQNNLSLSNLVWKYPVGLGSHTRNGFAFIPMFSRYLINREGVVYDSQTMRILKAHFNKGYYSYSLSPDLGHRTSLKRHRGMCLAFTDYPTNVDDLQVNHKNGIVGDDWLENLEWVSGSENRLHAVKNGLTNINKPVLMRRLDTMVEHEFYSLSAFCSNFGLSEKKVSEALRNPDEPLVWNGFEISYKDPKHASTEPTNRCVILVRDVRTGEVQEYNSIVSCSKTLGISKHTVNWRINTPTNSLYPDYKQFKRASDLTPWYIPVDHERELLECSWAKIVEVRDVVTGVVMEFETQRIASAKLGISESTLHQWLSRSNQPVHRSPIGERLVQVKNKSDVTRWRIPIDPDKEVIERLTSKTVLVRDHLSSEVFEFKSAKECAQTLGIGETALNYRLKSKGQKTFVDKIEDVKVFRQFKYKNDQESFPSV